MKMQQSESNDFFSTNLDLLYVSYTKNYVAFKLL